MGWVGPATGIMVRHTGGEHTASTHDKNARDRLAGRMAMCADRISTRCGVAVGIEVLPHPNRDGYVVNVAAGSTGAVEAVMAFVSAYVSKTADFEATEAGFIAFVPAENVP